MPYQRKRTLQELNLSDDFLFSKVFSDAEVCRQVLEKILKVKIKRIKFVESQKSIDLVMDSKAIRLDIYVQDEKETIYNVEMQNDKYPDESHLPKRSRYYQGNMDLDLIQKGESYLGLKKSFVIFICTFDPIGVGRHIYTFQNTCQEDFNLTLNDERAIIYLNTRGKLDDVDESLKELLRYIENTTECNAEESKSSLIKMLNNKVSQVKQDKRLEVEYMTLLEIKERELQKGIKIGIEQGIEQGKEEEKVEIAQNLLDVLDDETIALKTGLTIEEVRRLRNEKNN